LLEERCRGLGCVSGQTDATRQGALLRNGGWQGASSALTTALAITVCEGNWISRARSATRGVGILEVLSSLPVIVASYLPSDMSQELC
jgi:hypothetical protein